MFLWFSRLRSRENQIVRVGSRRRKINQSQCMLVPTLYNGTSSFVARQNGRLFATPSMAPFRNEVRKTSAEMPYWWRVTTQNWVVLLIGWSKFPPGSANQKHYTQICVVTSRQYGISTIVPHRTFRGEISGGDAKCRLFSLASFFAFDCDPLNLVFSKS